MMTYQPVDCVSNGPHVYLSSTCVFVPDDPIILCLNILKIGTVQKKIGHGLGF